MIIETACELRGSKHGQPLARNPKPFGSGGAAVAAGAGGGHSVSDCEQPAGTTLGAAVTTGTVGNEGKVTGGRVGVAAVTATTETTTAGGVGTVAKTNCWSAELLAVAPVGGNVAPGASVMYGNGVTRGGCGFGNFFGKQLQKLASQWAPKCDRMSRS